MQTLPPDRQMLAARTHSRVWDRAEVGAAIVRHRRRAQLADVLCWIASIALLVATVALAWL